MNENTGDKKNRNDSTVQKNASEAIISQNYMDGLLFKFDEKLFERQLQIATSTIGVKIDPTVLTIRSPNSSFEVK